MVVDPWGVNLRHDRWYLLCWSHSADARRVLRLDRIESFSRLTERFEPPADLDVVATVDEHMAEGWGQQVVVEVEACAEEVAACLPRSLGRLEELAPGRTRVVGSTDDPRWYAEHLLRLDVPFKVEAPDELRHACRALAERLLAAVRDEA